MAIYDDVKQGSYKNAINVLAKKTDEITGNYPVFAKQIMLETPVTLKEKSGYYALTPAIASKDLKNYVDDGYTIFDFYPTSISFSSSEEFSQGDNIKDSCGVFLYGRISYDEMTKTIRQKELLWVPYFMPDIENYPYAYLNIIINCVRNCE